MSPFRKIIFVFTIALSVAGAGLFGQEATPGAAGATPIEVTAKKYEFNPAVIKVKQGDHVKLVITATDRDHGFKLAAYNIDSASTKACPPRSSSRLTAPVPFPLSARWCAAWVTIV